MPDTKTNTLGTKTLTTKVLQLNETNNKLLDELTATKKQLDTVLEENSSILKRLTLLES